MGQLHRGHPWFAAALLLCCTATASANSSGIVGESGKQGETCSGHHTGGVAPLVRLDGPAVVAASALATFRFSVESQSPDQILAGLNVAASGGQLGTIAGQGTQAEEFRDNQGQSSTEITHTRPRMNDASGTASWLLTWRAPAAAGVQTLFAAGNSVDGFGNMEGDQAAVTQVDVEVGCLGDCGGDSEVTIGDLITAVRLAQGGSDINACRLADGNGDGAVQLQELIGALRNSLHGCN
jgi:hypothetical protein